MKKESPLHLVIGKWINEEFKKDYQVVRDPQCCDGKEKQYVPLFRTRKKAQYELCNVDLLIHNGTRVLVVVEIEESDVKPTQIFGKFFTTFFSNSYRHSSSGNRKIILDGPYLFIQIADTERLPSRTSKKLQFKLIEYLIRKFLKELHSKITYKLIHTCIDEVCDSDLVSCIQKHLKRHVS